MLQYSVNPLSTFYFKCIATPSPIGEAKILQKVKLGLDAVTTTQLQGPLCSFSSFIKRNITLLSSVPLPHKKSNLVFQRLSIFSFKMYIFKGETRIFLPPFSTRPWRHCRQVGWCWVTVCTVGGKSVTDTTCQKFAHTTY